MGKDINFLAAVEPLRAYLGPGFPLIGNTFLIPKDLIEDADKISKLQLPYDSQQMENTTDAGQPASNQPALVKPRPIHSPEEMPEAATLTNSGFGLPDVLVHTDKYTGAIKWHNQINTALQPHF